MAKRPSPKSDRFKVVNGQRHNFSILYHAVLDHYGAQLKPHGLATYWALYRFASKEMTCYPSHETLAERTGQSIASVKRSLKTLAALGLIRITMRRPRTSIYTILDVPERPDNSSESTSAESTVNSSEGPINRSQGAINSSEGPIEQLSVSYELDVVEVDPLNKTHSTTSTPTPPSEVMTPLAPKSADVVDVVEPVAIAQGEEAKATDGGIGRGVPLWRQFYKVYPTHGYPEKVEAEWDRQGCDAVTLEVIITKLPWQRELTGRLALPDLPHIYLKHQRWLDVPTVAASARPRVNGDGTVIYPAEIERPLRCKVPDCPNPPEPTLSDTKCEMHAMATIDEEATRVLRALKEHDSEATIDQLEVAIWYEVEHYHKNGDWRAVMDLCTSCYQSIGEGLYREFLAQQIARVVTEYRAKPKPRLAVMN